ncbi:MAG TPA: hypothetical protein VKE69_10640, partial [Planctomycetota bacterium]|nr:hypothetical protein [Planctomycetota bacterium]
NSSSAAPKSFQVGGYLKYGVGTGGANVLALDGSGTFGIGQVATFVTTGCQPSTAGGLLWAAGRGNFPNFLGFGGTVLVDLATLGDGAPGSSDPGGTMSIPLAIPLVPGFVGATLDFQTLAIDLTLPAQLAFSNGVEATILP